MLAIQLILMLELSILLLLALVGGEQVNSLASENLKDEEIEERKIHRMTEKSCRRMK